MRLTPAQISDDIFLWNSLGHEYLRDASELIYSAMQCDDRRIAKELRIKAFALMALELNG